MPIKFTWIDTGRHCSPTPCIFILLRGEITVLTSAKANFSNLQALLSDVLSFQLAVVKVLWKIFIFKTCQASVLLWSILSTIIFQSLLYVCFSSFCVYICVFFLVYSVFLCYAYAHLDYLLYFPVYLRWSFLSVTAFIATCQKHSWIYLWTISISFLLLLLPCFIPSRFFLALLSAHSVLCWNTSFFTSSLVSVYLWIQTKVYYRCCFKVTPSVHLSNGISGI